MIKNFIFDIDGTLLDTIEMYIPALQSTLEKHGYSRDYDSLTKLFGITSVDILKIAGVKEDDIQPILKEWLDLAYTRTDRVTVFDGITSVLENLSKRPDINLVVVTSKTTDEYLSEFAKNYPISKLFDGYVTADDTSKHKPDPDPIVAGIREVEAIPEESIYIGDTGNDMKAAIAAKAHFGAAMWGTAQPENLASAEYKFATPNEILKLIQYAKGPRSVSSAWDLSI